MKIAKEIAEFLGRGDSNWFTIVINREDFDAAIAVKLEPVREALVGMWDNPGRLSPSEMMEKYEAALALFEEEDEHRPQAA